MTTKRDALEPWKILDSDYANANANNESLKTSITTRDINIGSGDQSISFGAESLVLYLTTIWILRFRQKNLLLHYNFLLCWLL